MATTVSIYLPIPYYNLLIIIVSTAVLVWTLRAAKRLARVIAVRTAALNDSLVLIRGIGPNLLNFEGASQTHMNAIIHTRPVKPPSHVNILYLPFVISSTDVKVNSSNEGLVLEAQIWVATTTYVMVLSNFNANSFKQKFRAMKDSGSKVINEMNKTSSTTPDLASVRRNEFTESMVRLGTCQHISQPLVILAGHNRVKLPLFSYGANSTTNVANDFVYALLLIPMLSPTSTTLSTTLNSTLSTSSSSRNPVYDAPTSQGTDRRTQLTTSQRIRSIANRFTGSGAVAVDTIDRDQPHRHRPTNSTLAISPNNSTNADSVDPTSTTSLRDPLAPQGSTSPVATTSFSKESPDVVRLEYAIHVFGNIGSGSITDTSGSKTAESKTTATTTPASSTKGTSATTTTATLLQNKSLSSAGSVSCQEVLLVAKDGDLFSMHDIFGLKKPPPPPQSPVTAGKSAPMTNQTTFEENDNNNSTKQLLEDESIPPSDREIVERLISNNNNSSSKHNSSSSKVQQQPTDEEAPPATEEEADNSENECVVCLTEDKAVLLMPCRHLCVCATCLPHIDKCPVCRTPFDEYIVINNNSSSNTILRTPLSYSN